MAGEIFIDTSGFYALLVRGDDGHQRAQVLSGKGVSGKGEFAILPDGTASHGNLEIPLGRVARFQKAWIRRVRR